MLARRIPVWCRTTLDSFQQYSSVAASKPRIAASQPISKAIKQGGKHKSHKLPDDPYLLSNKVSRLITTGKHEEAMDLVKNAPIRLQSEVVWNQLISGQASQGKCNGAFKTLNEVRVLGILFMALRKNIPMDIHFSTDEAKRFQPQRNHLYEFDDGFGKESK